MIESLMSELGGPMSLPWAVIAVRLVGAVVLCGLIGYERESQHRPAGLRTHMLIAVAACLFALVALEMMTLAHDVKPDPLRLIEAVTAGVAFLVAGSIISSGGRVQGLTTGAGMWLSGATGLACGTGHLALATLATVIAVIILWGVRPVSERIGRE